MGKKKFAKNPLLYIHQPTISTPKAPMQSNYKSSAKRGPDTTNKKEQVTVNPAKKQPVRKTAFEKQFNRTKTENMEADTTDKEAEDNSEKLEDNEEREPVKFKDRTLEEKVAYFTDAPDFAPKMRCEVKTDERTYRGYIVDKQEADVYMRVGKRNMNTKIPMQKIISIQMLGF